MRTLCVEDLADALMHAEEILADYRGKAAGGDACARSLYVISDLRSQSSKFKIQRPMALRSFHLIHELITRSHLLLFSSSFDIDDHALATTEFRP